MTGIETTWFAWQGIPVTMALAVVATIGYLVGRWRRSNSPINTSSDELRRAFDIARSLEGVVDSLRRDLATHYSEVERFKDELRQASNLDDEASWRALRGEAERVLTPTLRLAGQVANAYDQIRRQSQAISNFSGGRTDPLTGLSNHRALDEILEMELSGHEASQGELCIAVLSLASGASGGSAEARREQQERMVRAAELLKSQLRDRDLAARYGTDEFVVVMPYTRLFGASVLGRRLRENLAQQGGMVANCGLAQSRGGDSPKSLLARADSALYSARAAGEGLQYIHTGQVVKADNEGEAPIKPEAAPESASLRLVDVVGE